MPSAGSLEDPGTREAEAAGGPRVPGGWSQKAPRNWKESAPLGREVHCFAEIDLQK